MPRLAPVIPLLLLTVHARAQAPSRPTGAAEALKQLLQIEADVARANRECDYRFFARVEAAEFFFTGADGSVTTRAEDLAGEPSCHRTDAPTTIDQPRLVWLGTTAILSARSSTTVTGRDGRPVVRRSRFTDAFVWRDERWQMVTGHSSRIPPDTAGAH